MIVSGAPNCGVTYDRQSDHHNSFIIQATELGLYYKHTMIVKYASSIINKLEVLLTDDARVIIYDHHVSIVHATVLGLYYKNMTVVNDNRPE
jgi:hypothetical protein